MKRTTLVLLLGTLFATSNVGAASRLDQTAWSITGKDKVKIPGQKALKTEVTDADAASLTIDPASQFTMPVPGAFLSGTVADKGAHGFTMEIDQAAVDAIQNRLTTLIIDLTGATSVDVTSMTVTAKGSVNKKGTKLKVKVKTVMEGSATSQGVQKSGKVKDTGTYKGVPSSS